MSKYRCTGVLFEMLVRQITADTLSNKSVSPAMSIMQRRFNTQTELGKEIQLYHAFFDNGALSESKAIDYIELICVQRKRLDERKLAQEKYDLIKDIKAHYPLKEFLASRIPNYTINASIYKTFTTEASKDVTTAILNIREVANARFTLIEHLVGQYKPKRAVSPDSDMLREYAAKSEDLRLLTYRVMVEKFNDKYGNLDESQKNLLREYINNVTSVGTLYAYVTKEVPRVKSDLQAIAKSSKNKITQIKLTEVVVQLDKITTAKTLRDNHINALMLAYEIIRESRI